MNTKNNKRRRESQEALEACFTELLQARELDEITVSELCKRTGLNRSTFYANYEDIYDLADTIRDKLELEVRELYRGDLTNSPMKEGYLKLFNHIKDNQLFYNTYFKLGYDSSHKIDFAELELTSAFVPEAHLEYHVEFHRAGLNAMVKKWLASGCQESPEEMNEIVNSEYTGRGFERSDRE